MPRPRPTRLEQMAADLRKQLDPIDNGWRQVALPGGLYIVLQRNGEQWRLALGREHVAPSDVEVDVCSHAFRVPPGSEPHWTTKRRQMPRTNRVAEYHVAEILWEELHR